MESQGVIKKRFQSSPEFGQEVEDAVKKLLKSTEETMAGTQGRPPNALITINRNVGIVGGILAIIVILVGLTALFLNIPHSIEKVGWQVEALTEKVVRLEGFHDGRVEARLDSLSSQYVTLNQAVANIGVPQEYLALGKRFSRLEKTTNSIKEQFADVQEKVSGFNDKLGFVAASVALVEQDREQIRSELANALNNQEALVAYWRETKRIAEREKYARMSDGRWCITEEGEKLLTPNLMGIVDGVVSHLPPAKTLNEGAFLINLFTQLSYKDNTVYFYRVAQDLQVAPEVIVGTMLSYAIGKVHDGTNEYMIKK